MRSSAEPCRSCACHIRDTPKLSITYKPSSTKLLAVRGSTIDILKIRKADLDLNHCFWNIFTYLHVYDEECEILKDIKFKWRSLVHIWSFKINSYEITRLQIELLLLGAKDIHKEKVKTIFQHCLYTNSATYL
jgi:hypothetical protein